MLVRRVHRHGETVTEPPVVRDYEHTSEVTCKIDTGPFRGIMVVRSLQVIGLRKYEVLSYSTRYVGWPPIL